MTRSTKADYASTRPSTVLKHCTSHDPLERPPIEDVVSRLEEICERVAAKPKKRVSQFIMSKPMSKHKVKEESENSWSAGSALGTALETFSSRIEPTEDRQKMDQLQKEIKEVLGRKAVDPSSGVFNAARLYRFLRTNKMDVFDTIAAIVDNFNARHDYKMDEKR